MKFAAHIIALLSVILLSSSLLADDDNERARTLLKHGKIVSLESLLGTIREHGDWQLLELELDEHRDRLIYEVELLDQQGKVHKLYYDAETGKEIKHEK